MKTLAFVFGLVIGFLLLPMFFIPQILIANLTIKAVIYVILFVVNFISFILTNDRLDGEEDVILLIIGLLLGVAMSIGSFILFPRSVILIWGMVSLQVISIVVFPIITKKISLLRDYKVSG